MRILDLPLKGEWYNMIEANIKTEEYREIKPYWIKRLCDNADKLWQCADCDGLLMCSLCLCFSPKNYTHIRFRYGYTSRTMLREIESITIGMGKPEWGAPTDKQVFIIKLKPLCCPSTNC